MKHLVHKFRVKNGYDARKMTSRKLAHNFLIYGQLTTTHKKAKFLKSYLERIIEKAKVKTEAHKNYLYKHLADQKIIKNLFEQVGPSFKDYTGGYVRVVKLLPRDSDGASLSKVEWAHPIVKKDSQENKS